MNQEEYIKSGALEACIMGLATNAEMETFYEMQKNYTEVKNYATEFEILLEKNYTENSPLKPNEIVFDKIKKELNFSNLETPIVAINTNEKQVGFWKKYGIAASIALVCGSTIVNFNLMNRVKNLQSENNKLAQNTTLNNSNAQYAFLKDPSIMPIAMPGVGIHAICRCTLYLNEQNNKAYFITHHLFNAGENNDYQLWAIVNGNNVSCGIITLTEDRKIVEVNNIPKGVTGFFLTLEKKGGNTTPTMQQMYLNGKIST